MMSLGHNLRAARGRLGLTQHELCLRATVSIGLIRRLEGGDTQKPHAGTLPKLATALGISVESLMGCSTTPGPR